jgi:prostaglandin-H2 D-isomerase / glutathione transferase
MRLLPPLLLIILALPSLQIVVATTMQNSIKLSYFDIEGAAEHVRLALLLSRTPFEDHRISWAEWPAMKPTTPNGQVPIMTFEDGSVRAQSKAMLRWVGSTKSSTLYPKEKLFDIEEVIGDVEDMQRAFTPAQQMGSRATAFGHPDGFEKTEEGKQLVQSMRRKFVTEELPNYIKRLTDRMEKHGGPFLVAGTGPTIADCVAVPALRAFTKGHIDYVDTNCLEAHPAIVSYIQNFCALEPIKGHYTDGLHE